MAVRDYLREAAGIAATMTLLGMLALLIDGTLAHSSIETVLVYGGLGFALFFAIGLAFRFFYHRKW